MVQKQEVSTSKAIFALFLIIFAILLIVYTLFYVNSSKNTYKSALNHAVSVQTSSSDAVAKLYKIVRLPNNAQQFAVLPYEYNQPYGLLVLTSKTKELDSKYIPKKLEGVVIPSYVGGGPMQVREELNAALTQMYEAAKRNGLFIMVRSAYRAYPDQKQLKQLAGNSETVAEPGESEHQTGLAVDINSSSPNCGDVCSLDFTTAAWLVKNAPNYGFILRYPQGKQDETGYPYESWHFRYIGVPAAKAVAASALTFDEAYKIIESIGASK